MVINDDERRKIAANLREPKESLLAYADDELIRLRREVGCAPRQDLYERIADLIDRPKCRDLVEHGPDPFVPGKLMTDGFFYCSACGWDGCLWEYVGFGDMTACEALYCPKCGKEIER